MMAMNDTRTSVSRHFGDHFPVACEGRGAICPRRMAEKMKRRETGDDDARPSKKFRDGGDAGEEKKPGNDDHKIIVVGLPKNVTDTKLQQMCEGFGTVARAGPCGL